MMDLLFVCNSHTRRDDVKINWEDAGRFVRKNGVSGCLFNLSVVNYGIP